MSQDPSLSSSQEQVTAVDSLPESIQELADADSSSSQESSPSASIEEPLVSVIIPTYNSTTYLAQCIESVLSQTYGNLEIIIVDDGSTDETVEQLTAYAQQDSRLTIIQQENAGPGAARNNGMEQAKGEYLLFVDSDDWCEPNLISACVEALIVTGADMATFLHNEYDQRVERSVRPWWNKPQEVFPAKVTNWQDNPDYIFRAFQNFPWNKMFRTQFVRDNSLKFQEIYLTEDLTFSAPALVCAQKIAQIPQVLYTHRVGTGTNIMANKDAHAFDFIEAYTWFKDWLMAHDPERKLYKAYVNWAVDGCMYNLHTLTSYDGFTEVYDKLKSETLHDLGLLEISPENYFELGYTEFLDNVRAMDAQHYLFRLYRIALDNSEKYSFETASLWDWGHLMEKQRDESYADAAQLRIWLQETHDMHDALQERYDELQARFDEQMNAAEQKVGQAICALPRAIQRKLNKQ